MWGYVSKTKPTHAHTHIPTYMPYLAAGVAIIVALVLLAYWELIIVEGAHLGPGVVVWLYDLAARRYDRIKQLRRHQQFCFMSA